jgi:DNA topoisomerase IA
MLKVSFVIFQLSPDAKYKEMTVTFDIGGEEFETTGKRVIDPGFTEMMTWKQVEGKEMLELKKGDVLQIGQVNSVLFFRIIEELKS